MNNTNELISRQVALKCAVELAKHGRIAVTEIIDKAEKMSYWIQK